MGARGGYTHQEEKSQETKYRGQGLPIDALHHQDCCPFYLVLSLPSNGRECSKSEEGRRAPGQVDRWRDGREEGKGARPQPASLVASTSLASRAAGTGVGGDGTGSCALHAPQLPSPGGGKLNPIHASVLEL